MKRKLLVSFSGLIARLAHGQFAISDLNDALMYFGCTREYLMEGKMPSEIVKAIEDAEKQATMLSAIRRMIETAEHDGRIDWRPHGGYLSYTQLNKLLVKNGFKPIDPLGQKYDYPVVAEAVIAADLPLEVVF